MLDEVPPWQRGQVERGEKMAKYSTRIWGDVIEIEANFAEASSQIMGTNGRQVADFRHDPATAMRYALEQFAVESGSRLDDEEVQGAIDDAVAGMASE